MLELGSWRTISSVLLFLMMDCAGHPRGTKPRKLFTTFGNRVSSTTHFEVQRRTLDP